MTTDAESTTADEQVKAVRLAHHMGRMQGRLEQQLEQLRAKNETGDREPQTPRLNPNGVNESIADTRKPQAPRFDEQYARMDAREAWRDAWIERMEARFDRMEAKLDLTAWIMGAAIVASIAKVALTLFQKLS